MAPPPRCRRRRPRRGTAWCWLSCSLASALAATATTTATNSPPTPARPPSLDDLCADWQTREDGFGFDSVGRVGPPLASLRGTGLAGSANVLPVGALTFPPYVVGTSSYHVEGAPLTDPQRPGHGEPGFPDPLTGYTGRLAINGTLVSPNRSRWCAHKVERAADVRLGGVDLVVLTTVSLAAEARAVFFDVQITAAGNRDGMQMPTFEVSLEMQGVVRMYNHSTDWQFGHNTTFANATRVPDDFAVTELPDGAPGVAVADGRPVCGGAATAFLLSEAPAALELAPQVPVQSPPLPSSSSPSPSSISSALAGANDAARAAATTQLPGGRATFFWGGGAAVAGNSPPQSTRAFRVGIVLGVAEGPVEAHMVAAALVAPGGGGAAGFAAGLAAAQAAWQDRWDAAFTPGANTSYFSGHLPVFSAGAVVNAGGDMDTELGGGGGGGGSTGSGKAATVTTTTAGEDLQRIYYLSLVSFLSMQRVVKDTHTATTFTRAYATGGPRTGVTTLYFWDMPYQATVLALLDPAYLRQYILAALRSGSLADAYEINYMTGQGEGRRYSFNELSLFTAIDDYLRVTGDASLLWEPLPVPGRRQQQNNSVLCALHDLATHYASLPQIQGLADYGGNMNLLECVPEYSHAVPALNAANVWMLRELARLDDHVLAANATADLLPGPLPACVQSGTPAALRARADAVLKALLPTYVTGRGYWRSLHNDTAATAVEVRTVIDFHTVGALLGAPAAQPPDPFHAAGAGALADSQRDEMAAFVAAELVTPDWMRALSILDAFANVSSFRPDHGTLGSYDAWPAQTMVALLAMEKPAEALDLARRIAGGGATRRGPFGQAHTLLSSHPDDVTAHGDALFGGRRLCNSTSVPTEHCTAWKSEIWAQQGLNAASGPFANSVLRAFFGFQPPLPFAAPNGTAAAAHALRRPGLPRGFDGSLHGVAWSGQLWDVTSKAAVGLEFSPTGAALSARPFTAAAAPPKTQ